MEDFLDYITDDIIWDMHTSSGHTTFRGRKEIEGMGGDDMPSPMNFKFGTIVIEDNVASVQGTATGTTKDGKPYDSAFCDVYHFTGDKVSKITSYVIDHAKKD